MGRRRLFCEIEFKVERVYNDKLYYFFNRYLINGRYFIINL